MDRNYVCGLLVQNKFLFFLHFLQNMQSVALDLGHCANSDSGVDGDPE